MNGLFLQMSMSVSQSLGELFPGRELGEKKDFLSFEMHMWTWD